MMQNANSMLYLHMVINFSMSLNTCIKLIAYVDFFFTNRQLLEMNLEQVVDREIVHKTVLTHVFDMMPNKVNLEHLAVISEKIS